MMRLHAVVFENSADATSRLHSAWDDEQVASDPELLSRRVADALIPVGVERAGVAIFELDDMAVRACLARSRPDTAERPTT